MRQNRRGYTYQVCANFFGLTRDVAVSIVPDSQGTLNHASNRWFR